MKLVRLNDELVAFKCPGCRGPQQLPVTGPKAWKWDGSMESPTFEPSILTTWDGLSDPGDGKSQRVKKVCHSFVRNGKIEFLSDCTHRLAGQTVELPEVTDESSLFYKPSEL